VVPNVGRRRAAVALGALAACLLVLAVASPAAMASASIYGSASRVTAGANGAQRILYKVGPFHVIPGQNDIGYQPIAQKPKVDGWITRIKPDLTYTNGTVPRVDVIHLHHGVWLNMSRKDATANLPERFFASGEEKTRMELPKGYGYRYKASDTWLLNHMIHNLTPVPADVYMTYEVDFIPDSSPAARGIRAARPIWMDVENGRLYPVFDVQKGSGRKGVFTYPNMRANAYGGQAPRNEWVVDRPGVLIATAGHLHPGGLHTDLWVRRPGARIARAACASKPSAAARRRCRNTAPRGSGSSAHLFTSKAKYFEPAGAVSWDVAMTGTRPDWRVKLRRGDVLWTSATYDTNRASWWESMGIMVAWMADSGPGKDPFKRRVDFPGQPTHGHLYENRNHGGNRVILPDPRKLPDGPQVTLPIDIADFKYTVGDLSLTGQNRLPPVVKTGQSLTFVNTEDGKHLYHSLTSCKAPCNRNTGIAYPIADSSVQFESNTLGSRIPAHGSITWKTPTSLKPGTYTYFCRIHPFMRGSFRVEK
jgi:plastocyanin